MLTGAWVARRLGVPALGAVVGVALAAQLAAAQDSAGPGPRCVAGRASPGCGVTLLTNFGMYGISATSAGGGHFRVAADWGPLFDVSQRAAVGVTLFASLDADGLQLGPALRFRRKLAAPGRTLEISLGAPLTSSGDQLLLSPYGMIKWSPAPGYGLVLRPEWRRVSNYDCSLTVPVVCAPVTRGTIAISAGLELGGVPGIIATGATVVGVVALVIAYVSGADL